MKHYSDDWLDIYQGDVRAVLPELASDSVDCIVTSPPFWGLRDYGTATWSGGDAECEHRVGGQVQDTKWSGAITTGQRPGVDASTCLVCGAVRQDSQLGLERTPEEYVANMVAVFRELRRVLKPSGTCWLNLGDSYASSGGERTYGSSDNGTGRGDGTRRHDVPATGLKPKDLVGIPWRVAFALQADGWYLRSDIIWAKPNPMPESVTDRPTKAHEYLFLLTKSARYYFDADAVREKGATGSWTAMPPIGGVKQTNGNDNPTYSGNQPPSDGNRNLRSVWNIATRPYPGAHFAVFPPELPERCIKAGSSERGVCPECGAPWERVTERTALRRDEGLPSERAPGGNKHRLNPDRNESNGPGNLSEVAGYAVTTTGWRPGRAKPGTYEAEAVANPHSERRGPKHNFGNGNSEPKVWSDRCTHEVDPVPAVVLDPFAGSGTTGMVANRLSRRAILIDLNGDYLKQQLERNAQTPLGLGA